MPSLRIPREDTYSLSWNSVRGPFPSAHIRLQEYVRYLNENGTVKIPYVLHDIGEIFYCHGDDRMESISMFATIVTALEEYIARAPIELREYLLKSYCGVVFPLAVYATWRYPQSIVPYALREAEADSPPYATWRIGIPYKIHHPALEVAFRTLMNRSRTFLFVQYWTRMMEGEAVHVAKDVLLRCMYYDFILSSKYIRSSITIDFASWLPFLETTDEVEAFATLLWTQRLSSDPNGLADYLVNYLINLPIEDTEEFYQLAETILLVADYFDAIDSLTYQKEIFDALWRTAASVPITDESLNMIRAMGHVFVAILKTHTEEMLSHIPNFLEVLHQCMALIKEEGFQDDLPEEFSDIFYHILGMSLMHVLNRDNPRHEPWITTTLEHVRRIREYDVYGFDTTQWSLIVGNILQRVAPSRSPTYLKTALSALHHLTTYELIGLSPYFASTALLAICLIGSQRSRSSLKEHITLVRSSGEYQNECETHRLYFQSELHLRDDHTELDYLALIPHTRKIIEMLWKIVMNNIRWWTTSMDWYLALMEKMFSHSLVYRELCSEPRIEHIMRECEDYFPDRVHTIRSLVESLVHFQHIHPSVYRAPDGSLDVDTLQLDTPSESQEISLHYPERPTSVSTGLQERIFEAIRDPITRDLMQHPVVASDSHTYDYQSIQTSIRIRGLTSPITRASIMRTFISNHLVSLVTQDFEISNSDEELMERLGEHLKCPRSKRLMKHPSILPNGQTVEASIDDKDARPNIMIGCVLSIYNNALYVVHDE